MSVRVAFIFWKAACLCSSCLITYKYPPFLCVCLRLRQGPKAAAALTAFFFFFCRIVEAKRRRQRETPAGLLRRPSWRNTKRTRPAAAPGMGCLSEHMLHGDRAPRERRGVKKKMRGGMRGKGKGGAGRGGASLTQGTIRETDGEVRVREIINREVEEVGVDG